VKASLRRLRSAKVCVTNGELDAGMTGLGVPLHDPAGSVDASLGFVLPYTVLTTERLAMISTALLAASIEIDALLGLIAAARNQR
jgi:DNA-binding IclR family transcriptional regulator